MANRYYNNSKVDGETWADTDVEAIEDGFQTVEDEMDLKQGLDATLTSIAALGMP